MPMNPTVAFLFDSTNPNIIGNYADPAIVAVVEAVRAAAGKQSLFYRMFIGDVALRVLAERPISVSIQERTPEKRHRGRTTTTTVDSDHQLLKAITWDLLDNVQEQWHTVALEDVLDQLTGNALFCVSCYNLPLAIAVDADRRLESSPSYVGAMQIDLGSPVQRAAFLLYLIPEAVVIGEEMWVQSEDGEERIAPSWTSRLDYAVTTVLYNAEFPQHAPNFVLPSELSRNGARTAQLISAHRNPTARAALIDQVVAMSDVTELPGYRYIEIRLPLDTALMEAEVPEGKLINYALSTTHPEGKHKAELFRQLLGIEAKDWRYLAAQLLRGLPHARIEKVRLSEYGVKYSANIPVKGLNDEVRMVTTGWLALGDAPAKLTTLYVAPKKVELDGAASVPPIVTNAGTPQEHWERLYEAAVQEGVMRASLTIPTPMRIGGFDLVREGECGFAGVRILDGRSAFARWLRNSTIGHRHYRKGWYVSADTGSHSVQINRAYAEAFAEVLRLNDIQCEVEWQFD